MICAIEACDDDLGGETGEQGNGGTGIGSKRVCGGDLLFEHTVQKQGMKNQSDDWRVLDLTDAEGKILWAFIEHGAMAVSKTARTAKVARTTVDAALRRLSARGLVRRVPATGHVSAWKAVRTDLAKREMLEAAQPFEREQLPPDEAEVIGGIDAEEIGISVYRGKNQILRAYERLFRLSKAERFLFIQGNKAIEAELSKLDRSYLFSFHTKLKKAGVIMEGINGESVRDFFKRLTIRDLESHFGRLVIASLVPDKYMDFDLDVVVLRNTILFIDVRTEVVVIIRHAGIVAFFTLLSAFIKDHGSSFDLNSYLRELILEKNT